jgi:hypothetical protein
MPRAAASYGLALPLGRGLVGALAHFGLDARAGAEKDAMRQLVLRGGPWSQSERQAILEWLQVEASKAARWLGHVPFDRIVDARNDAPVIIVRDDDAPEVPMVSSRILHPMVPRPKLKHKISRYTRVAAAPQSKFRAAPGARRAAKSAAPAWLWQHSRRGRRR